MPRKYEVGDNSGLNITCNLEQQQQALYSFTQRFWKKKKNTIWVQVGKIKSEINRAVF